MARFLGLNTNLSRIFRGLLVSAFFLGLHLAPPAVAQPENLLVFAAASLKDALDGVNRVWESDTGKTATIVYAASNLLAKQIEAGAPADVFLSADIDWMNYAASRGLIREDDRVNLLGNTLVLIAPKDARVDSAPSSIGSMLGSGYLAMGNVDGVPVGKYGKAALEYLGEWEKVKNKIVQSESARAALLLVSRGEASFGIVYRTDAAADPNVKVVREIPQASYPPVYPVAPTTDSKHSDATEFMAFLRSAKAKSLFETQGFTVLDQWSARP